MDSFAATTDNLVAVRGGQHSGAEDCVMRYAVANYYRVDDHVYYHSDPPDQKGSRLCTSPAGTGVNAAGRLPHPRYGDAAPGRGNCASQICVNDAYDHRPR